MSGTPALDLRGLVISMRSRGDQLALVTPEQGATGHQRTSYAELTQAIEQWQRELESRAIAPGSVAALEGDYSKPVIAGLLAMALRGLVVAPMISAAVGQREELYRIAQVGTIFALDASGTITSTRSTHAVDHPVLRKLTDANRPGLVIYSSGSTGQSKAAVHDFNGLLEKFSSPRPSFVTLSLLLLDHIGGFNVMLRTLATGGTLVVPRDRGPETVASAMAEFHVELLPATPSFLNLLLLSDAHRRHDLSQLKVISYGTEVMPLATLRRLRQELPGVDLQQAYGMTELGILRSKSRDGDSLWVKLGGPGVELKVVDQTLWVRTKTAMLGYLNAPNPFDAEGWLDTGDAVEVDGEYLRILGRRSELINVAGQKVYPAEVEDVLLGMDNVRDVTVRGESNPLLGQVVGAYVNLQQPEEAIGFRNRVRAFCKDKLEPFKVPAKVQIVEHEQFNVRFKRVRKSS